MVRRVSPTILPTIFSMNHFLKISTKVSLNTILIWFGVGGIIKHFAYIIIDMRKLKSKFWPKMLKKCKFQREKNIWIEISTHHSWCVKLFIFLYNNSLHEDICVYCYGYIDHLWNKSRIMRYGDTWCFIDKSFIFCQFLYFLEWSLVFVCSNFAWSS